MGIRFSENRAKKNEITVSCRIRGDTMVGKRRSVLIAGVPFAGSGPAAPASTCEREAVRTGGATRRRMKRRIVARDYGVEVL